MIGLDQKYKYKLEEYRQNIDSDFNTEWSKKKFKWFFTNRRKKKLWVKIYKRYQGKIFVAIEDIIYEILPQAMGRFIEQLTDVKDITLGDKNYFVEENNK